MRKTILLMSLSILMSCKSQDQNQNEVVSRTVRQYVEDFNFKRNQTIQIDRLDLLSVTEKSILYLDTIAYIELSNRITFETDLFREMMEEFEDKVNQYSKFKVLSGGETDLTKIYKAEAEQAQRKFHEQKELLSRLLKEDSVLNLKLKNYKGDSTMKVATFYFKGVVSDTKGNSQNILDTVDYFLTNDLKRVLN